MRLTVFGATGGTGQFFVRQALEEGHVVTAVARRPEAVEPAHPGLEVVKGDVLAGAAVGLGDADAVVFLAGPRGLGPTTVYSQGCRRVLEAMADAGVKRLVAVTAALADGRSDQAVQRVSKVLMRNTMLRGPYRDHQRLLEILWPSTLDWTVVRPPRLHDRPARGTFRVAVGDTVRGGLSIARQDLATAILRILPDRGTLRQTVDVGY